MIGSTTVSYPDFIGDLIPVSSGGPVLNIEDKVIGIINGELDMVVDDDITKAFRKIALSIKPLLINEDSFKTDLTGSPFIVRPGE